MIDLLTAFVALFAIVEPIGAIPTLMVLTRGFTPAERKHVVVQACAVALGVLLAFALAGQYIFQFFGFSLAAFQIAGGLLLFKVAWDMLHGQRPRTKFTQADEDEAADRTAIGIAPIGVPLLAGPGAITTAIILMSPQDLTVLDRVAVIVLIVAVVAISLAVLLASQRIHARIGDTGTTVITKIFGLILAAIAVQFILDGVKTAFGLPP